MWKSQYILIGIVLISWALSSCSRQGIIGNVSTSITVQQLPLEKLDFPKGVYTDAIWIDDKQIVVRYTSNMSVYSTGSDAGIWLASLTDTGFTEISLPPIDDPDCFSSSIGLPVRDTDHQVYFLRDCSTNNLGYVELLLWNAQHNTTTKVYTYPLPFEFADYSFSPDRQLGVFASRTGIQDRLRGVDSRGVFELNLAFDRALRPSWSPDGKLIAFVGNQRMFGPPSRDWVSQPSSLVLLNASCVTREFADCNSQLEFVTDGLWNELNLSWSPDSRWLAFDGIIRDSEQGIWLYSLENKKLFQIAVGDYGNPQWSPNGQKLLVFGPHEFLRQDDVIGSRTSLYTLDVRNVMTNSISTP